MGEQSTPFICITYQGKHNGSILSNKWTVYAAVGANKFSPCKNVWAAKQILPKIV